MDGFTSENVSVRVVVGITNVLTILGSGLILVSYLCFPSLRTGARLILLHLSLMDLVVGLAHLVGGVSDLNSKYNLTKSGPAGRNTYSVSPGIDVFCKIQAFVGYYAIISSVLWTVCLSVYMYLLNEHTLRMLNVIKYYIWLACAACYGIPLFLTLWTQLTGRLGYAPYDSAGWCTLITKDPITQQENSFVSVFGFDLWIYLAVVIITVLYVSNSLNVRSKKAQQRASIWSSIDYKFIFIPITFVFLRMWTCILDLLYYIYGNSPLPHSVAEPFLFLTGIGDSAQGFTNAILFVCFTKTVRDAFKRVLCLHCKRHGHREDDLINKSQRSTTLLESTDGNVSTAVADLRLKNVINLEDSIVVK